MIKRGDVFWLCCDGEPQPHIHVVISDQNKNPQIVFIPIVSRDYGLDETCVFYPGDHPRIKRDSVADYRMAKSLTEQEALSAHSIKLFKPVEPMSEDLLLKLIHGATMQVEMMPRGCKRILLEQGLLG